MAALRVVLDTNVLVSALAYPTSIPGRILEAWRQGGLEIVLSRYILDEMVRVLPKLSRNTMPSTDIRDLAESFLFLAEIVEPDAETEPVLRDKADQAVLGTFRTAQADFLITGDKDLLALSEQYPVLTPAAFWQRYGH